MAIDESYLKVLHKARRLYWPDMTRKIKTLCLAYPDLLVSARFLQAVLGRSDFKLSDRSDEIRAWHRLQPDFGPIFDTEDVLASFGIEMDVVDVAKIRGPERVLDLNGALPADLKGVYDLIIDAGTLEHCFNVGQAFRNMCDMAALGGVVSTLAPLSSVNHGFWNFSPTAFFDGFDQNGFQVAYLQARTKDGTGSQFMDFLPNPMLRASMPPEAGIMCIAQKIRDQPFKWPIQSKYRLILPASQN
jgi:hypothetical protein